MTSGVSIVSDENGSDFVNLDTVEHIIIYNSASESRCVKLRFTDGTEYITRVSVQVAQELKDKLNGL